MAYDFKQFEEKTNNVKTWLTKELATIRTGRATVTLLDGVNVEAYGSFSPLNQVATIGSEDARTIKISPFDPTQAQAIEKAINDADLGVSVNVDASGIRVIFPELTSERRDLLIKQAGKKLEEARISLRKERDDIWNEIQKSEKEGDISEDEKFQAKDDMQKIVDDLQKEMEEMLKSKEEEIRV